MPYYWLLFGGLALWNRKKISDKATAFTPCLHPLRKIQIVRIIQCWLTPAMPHCVKYPYQLDPLPKDEIFNGKCEYILYGFPWNQTEVSNPQEWYQTTLLTISHTTGT